MYIEILQSLFNRDLKQLKLEIESYQTESNLWIINAGISNSAGNLCLHLIGNLNTYIGANLGGNNYIRNRELEFSLKDIPQKELIDKIEETAKIVDENLRKLTDQQIEAEYPMLVLAEKTSIVFFLTHLTTHLAYHLGQINYHRRLLDE